MVTVISRQARLQSAALEYVIHGWGVVPGPACDGVRYTAGHCDRVVRGLVPALPSGRTLRDARVVWSWWRVAPYGVLARAGEDFDVISVPGALAREMSRRVRLSPNGCPVAKGPGGAVFLVRLGAVLRPELAAHGVRVIERGELVALPPTCVLGGTVKWSVHPTATQFMWDLGDAEEMQAALWDTAQRGIRARQGLPYRYRANGAVVDTTGGYLT
ncbi:hypothetical protein [Amycolatopsis pigmentata]|uniref:Bifunctional DNA primase/polymerase, N-terminal n=1 Tax=Amycolatopsis pigmentata TaxID=450801 RepID=A0ABW5G7G6_9PSEU